MLHLLVPLSLVLSLSNAQNTCIKYHSRCREAAEDIKHSSSSTVSISYEILDLENLASVRGFAEKIKATHDRLDILVNNAGLSTRNDKGRHTTQGFELCFGVNYLVRLFMRPLATTCQPSKYGQTFVDSWCISQGHYLLTRLLLPILNRSSEGRIVNLR